MARRRIANVTAPAASNAPPRAKSATAPTPSVGPSPVSGPPEGTRVTCDGGGVPDPPGGLGDDGGLVDGLGLGAATKQAEASMSASSNVTEAFRANTRPSTTASV